MSDEIYKSEDGCDKWIAENLQLQNIDQPGFYVDCGAAHPDRYSQTAWLRWLGWRGLAIDGNPAYADEWMNQPKVAFVAAVLSDQDFENFLIEPTNSLVSRVHENGEQVQARKLSSILREYGVEKIDLLSIDIEGSERKVLREMFIEGYRPNVIIAEYHSEHAGRDPHLIELLIRNGYDFVHMTNSNGVFLKK